MLSFCEQRLDSTHPLIAAICSNLALLYERQGKDGQAKPLYWRALKIYERQWGDIHPNISTICSNLTELYLKQGKDEQAEMLWKRAVKISLVSLGQEHSQTQLFMEAYQTCLLKRDPNGNTDAQLSLLLQREHDDNPGEEHVQE